MATSLQLQLPEPAASFVVQKVSQPQPSSNGVAVRIKAIGLNPIDWKSAVSGFRVPSWPAVLGSDLSGVVEAVGDQVAGFKVGDEVFGVARGDTAEGAGSFQEVCTVAPFVLAKKPASLSFEEAATLPVGVITAAAAIVNGLKLPLSGLSTSKLDSATAPKSVLVLGGSSVVGASVIQLLRLVLGPSATIVATSSPHNHAFLTEQMGATRCLDRAAQDDAAAMKAGSDGAVGYDAIVDPVGTCASQPQVFDALRSDGPKIFAEVATNSVTPTPAPEGVTSTLIIGNTIFDAENGKELMSYASKLVAERKFNVAAKVDVVGKGLEAVEPGLEKLKKGVSGAKLVVTI